MPLPTMAAMLVISGYLFAFGCIFGMYALHGGNLAVLIKALPFEMVIIGGGALGAFMVCNQPKTLKATLRVTLAVLRPSGRDKSRFLALMTLLYELLRKARKDGLMSIEGDVEEPHTSPLFAPFPQLLADAPVLEFLTDYLRMMVSGHLNAHEIEALMDSEIETHHAESNGPVQALNRLAGALPAFGIIGAVLGVVNTMGSIGQPPAVLGSMIASALVGTFLGILLAYALVEPLASLVEQRAQDAGKELECIKATLLASMLGYNPATAIEFGRKVLFSTERPSFTELEAHVKG